jgi:hypothetical protein
MRRFEQNVTELLTAVKEITAKQQLEDIQYELARITNLLPNLRNCDHLDRVAHLKLAVAALGADKPNLEFARAIRQDSEFLIQRTQRGMFRFVYRIAGTTPLSATLAGVASSGVAMVLVALVIYLMSWALGVRIENLRGAAGLALMMAVFAAIASFVSVITRLADVAKTRDYDPFLIFATGFFKPWVGASRSSSSRCWNRNSCISARRRQTATTSSISTCRWRSSPASANGWCRTSSREQRRKSPGRHR